MVTSRKPRFRGGAPDAAASTGGIDWPVYLFIAAAFTFVFLNIPTGRETPDLLLRDPDNYMRLVQVRDLLAGQSWWDVTQVRLGFGEHGNMHWSRLADIPLLLLIGLFSLFVDAARAEVWAVVVEPPLFLVPMLVCLAITARNLGGNTAASFARLLAITAPLLVAQFVPGRIDHHHLQLTLLAAVLAALTGRSSLRNGVLAGVGMALSLAIGLETAPLLAVAVGAAALCWAFAPSIAHRSLLGLVSGLLIAAPLFHALSVPPSEWLRATYDQMGRGHFAALALGGAALLAILRHPGGTQMHRLIQLCLAGLAAALAVLLAPEVLTPPYAALGPELQALWMDNISETASIGEIARSQPGELFSYYSFVVAALLAGLLHLRRAGHPARLSLILAVLAAGVLLTAMQVRAVAGASLLAVPVAAMVLASAWEVRAEAWGKARFAAALLLLNGVTGLGLQQLYLAALPRNASESPIAVEEIPPITDCQRAIRRAGLDRFAPGLVLAGMDSGPPILLRSHHSVLSAGYHRNIAGVRTAFAALLAEPARARMMLERAGVDYVFYCPSLDFGGLAGAGADSFGNRLAEGRPPEWLRPLAGGPAQGYAFYALR